MRITKIIYAEIFGLLHYFQNKYIITAMKGS